MIKKEKGIALMLTMLVLFALATLSVALLSINRTSSINTARSHRSIVTFQVAEFGIEDGKLDLVEELMDGSVEILVNDLTLNRADPELNLRTENCLALHGYTEPVDVPEDDDEPDFSTIYYNYASNDIDKYTVIDPDTGDELDVPIDNAGYRDYNNSTSIREFSNDVFFAGYSYLFFIQRVQMDTTLDGYNFVTQGTYKPDLSSSGENLETLRVYYRIISCGFSSGNHEYVVPLQAYYSTGGLPGEKFNIEKNLILTGYYRP
tara:strand:+ start:742 stop:1527 length:786 start_codon:yes stop_codon:yes gene_type:complete